MTVLHQGDFGDDSLALLVFSDSSRVELGPDTTVVLPRADGEKRQLFLQEGNIAAEIAKKPAAEAMIVETAHGHLESAGSTVNVSAGALVLAKGVLFGKTKIVFVALTTLALAASGMGWAEANGGGRSTVPAAGSARMPPTRARIAASSLTVDWAPLSSRAAETNPVYLLAISSP